LDHGSVSSDSGNSKSRGEGKKVKLLFIGTDDIHTPKWVKYFKEEGYPCLFHKIDGKRSVFKELNYLRSEVRAFEPDIVHTHYAGRNGLIGTLLNFHPHVVTVHGSEVLLSHFPKKQLVSWILRKADMVTTDSQAVEKKIWDMGVSCWNTEIVRFGVDVEFFYPYPKKDGKTIDPSIISLRSFESIYDIETLLRAFQIVLEHYPKADLVLLGGGRKYRSLVYLAQYLGIYDRTFFYGQMSPFSVRNHLRSSWVYVSTALSDAGLASSTAEAMACELPCVITDVAENAGWVCPYHLFKPGDYKTLAEIIIDLIENPDERELYGKLERDLIIEHNNYHTEMAKMETLYTNLILGGTRNERKESCGKRETQRHFV